MIEAICDCGAVRVEVDANAPHAVWDCQCSFCQKRGVLWVYYHPRQVRVIAGPQATSIYQRARRRLDFHACRTCGCTTHWIRVGEDKGPKMGVNARLMDPAIRRRAQIRRMGRA